MDKVKPLKDTRDSAAHTIYMDVREEEVLANTRSTGNTTLSYVGQANFLLSPMSSPGETICTSN